MDYVIKSIPSTVVLGELKDGELFMYTGKVYMVCHYNGLLCPEIEKGTFKGFTGNEKVIPIKNYVLEISIPGW